MRMIITCHVLINVVMTYLLLSSIVLTSIVYIFSYYGSQWDQKLSGY